MFSCIVIFSDLSFSESCQAKFIPVIYMELKSCGLCLHLPQVWQMNFTNQQYIYSLALSAVDHGSQPDFFRLLFWKLSNRDEERKLTLNMHFKNHSLHTPNKQQKNCTLPKSSNSFDFAPKLYEETSS